MQGKDIYNRKKFSAIADMLVFADRFAYSYSPKNMQLIYAQNDAAMFCASFEEWKQKGYQVKKGEHGMKIFVPVKAKFLELDDGTMVQLKYASKEQKEAYKTGKLEARTKVFFKIGHTFDVHQTTFPPEDYPKLVHRGYSSEEHAKCLESMIEWAKEELNCPTFYKDDVEIHGAALYGFFHVGKNEIHLSSSLKECEEKDDVKPEDSFSRVYDIFRKNIAVIDSYLERYVPGHLPDVDKKQEHFKDSQDKRSEVSDVEPEYGFRSRFKGV